MKKCLLLFLSIIFFLPHVNSQTIIGTPSVCNGSTTMLFGIPSGLSWSSSAPSIATVTSSGVVSGITAGTAVITYGTFPYTTVVVTVSPTSGPITGTSSSCAGATTTLYCSPGGGTWSSSNPAVAAVSSSGVVSGLVAGTSTISYTLSGGACPSTTVYAATTCCSGLPAPGLVVPSTTSGCTSTTVTMTDTGATFGTDYQWQKSFDSVSWTNIAGATSNFYGFIGVAASAYYRCKVICGFSGMSSATPGVKINSFPCCGGSAVSAGTASASTSYCSACSLTLNLSGASTGFDITYQWQFSSYAGGPWTNLLGATTTSYTYSPSGAYYYRCVVSCASGGVDYTSPVYVGYRYLIASNTVNPPDSACMSKFVISANGVSPLLYVKTYYGDGTRDSIPTISSGVTSHASTMHVYPYTGTYFVKKILCYNNVPQDSVTFSYVYNCKAFPIKLFFDLDGDCSKDTSEMWSFTPIRVKVDSNGVSVDTLSVTSGIYYKPLGGIGAVYSFSVLTSPFTAICPLSGVIYDTVQVGVTGYPLKYFGLSCGSTSIDLAVHTVPSRTRPNMQWGNIYVRNNFCTFINAEVKFDYSPKYNFGISASSTPPSLAYENTIVWNLGAMSSLSGLKTLYYRISSSPFLTINDTVKQRVVVTPATGSDVSFVDNIVIRNDTVRAGFDPNFVEVEPPGCFDSDSLHLQYTVHFENMGNDTAHNIYVLDTLSDYLDAKSLEIVMASHQMDVGIYKDGPYTVAKFDFPNIKLLDSSYHGLCDGAVIYTINSKPGIPVGETIKARAGIYFDINEVVMTNTAEKLRGCPAPAGVSEQSCLKPVLYPNPVNDELVVKAGQNVFTSFTITNSIGQEIIQKQLSGSQARVNVKALPAGIYYVVFTGWQGREVVKFVKE